MKMTNHFSAKTADMKTVILATAMLFVGAMSAQITQYVPNEAPTTPTASEFLKYGDVPVSKYTGIPNISIPIYTIEENDVSIPITLSYHAGGIRVSDEATWVGLGWRLDCGGQITQVVNGYDDFGTKPLVLPDYPSAIAGNSANCEDNVVDQLLQFSEIGPLVNHATVSVASVVKALNHNTQPDIFKYSFMGHSGDFIVDPQTKIPIGLSDDAVRIENLVANNPYMGFKITTPEGYIGSFGVVEKSYIDYSLTNIIETISSDFNTNTGDADFNGRGEDTYASINYKINQVTGPTSPLNSVEYEYASTGTTRLKSIPTQTQSVDFNELLRPRVCTASQDDNSALYLTETGISQEYLYPSKIKFHNEKGEVRFLSSDRKDFPGNKKLDKIEVYYDGKLIRSIDFSYGYFVTSGTGQQGYHNRLLNQGYFDRTSDHLKRRLRLETVAIDGRPPHRFTYNNTSLPMKTSYATDYWGYYNGEERNLNFFPNVRRFNMELGDNRFLLIDNNKSASSIYSKAAVLERIQYPTGGHTDFTYEPNTFTNFQVPDIDYDPSSSFLRSLQDDNTPGAPLSGSYDVLTFDELSTIIEFNVDRRVDQVDPDDFNRRLPCALDLDAGVLQVTAYPGNLKAVFENEYNRNVEAFVGDVLDGTINTAPITGGIRVVQPLPRNNNQFENQYTSIRKSLDFSNQYLYIIHANFRDRCATNNSQGGLLRATYSYDPNLGNNPINSGVSMGGGLRVSSIQNRIGGELTREKHFEYRNGKAMSPFQFIHYKVLDNINFLDDRGNSCFEVSRIFSKSLSSSSYLPVSSNAAGNYIGYDQVIEKNQVVDSRTATVLEDNGSIAETYTNNPDRLFFSGFQTIAPPLKDDTENGSLRQRTITDAVGNIVLEESFQYSYEEDEVNCYYGVKFAQFTFNGVARLGSDTVMPDDAFEVLYYPITFHKNVMLQSKKTDVYSNGSLLTTMDYEYTDNLLVRRTTTTTSETGYDIVEERSYPFDSEVSSMPFVQQLQEQNRIASPLVTQTYEAGEPTGNVVMEYGSYGNGLILPSLVETKKGNGIQENRVEYSDYDARANAVQYKLSFGPDMAYRWGYEGQYVVAKADNCSTEQLNTAITRALPSGYTTLEAFLTSLDAIATDTTQQRIWKEFNMDLREDSGLANSLVTTYVYDPLIGVTSMADTRGYIMYYSYDDLERLKEIRDQDNHLITDYDYRYIGQE